GPLASGTVVQVGILVRVSPTATMLLNTASAESTAPDPNPDNNRKDEPTTVLGAIADLSGTKILTTPAIPGQAATYQIVVTNQGPSDIAGATVVDPFPAAMTSVTWTCATPAGSSCTAPSGNGPLSTTVNLRAGGAATFVASGTLASGAVG